MYYVELTLSYFQFLKYFIASSSLFRHKISNLIKLSSSKTRDFLCAYDDDNL